MHMSKSPHDMLRNAARDILCQNKGLFILFLDLGPWVLFRIPCFVLPALFLIDLWIQVKNASPCSTAVGHAGEGE